MMRKMHTRNARGLACADVSTLVLRPLCSNSIYRMMFLSRGQITGARLQGTDYRSVFHPVQTLLTRNTIYDAVQALKNYDYRGMPPVLLFEFNVAGLRCS